MSPYRASGALETLKRVLEVLALIVGLYPQLWSAMRALFSRARRRTA